MFKAIIWDAICVFVMVEFYRGIFENSKLIFLRIIYVIISLMIIIEIFSLNALSSRKETLGTTGYKEKAYELKSMVGLSSIIADDNENIYCYYEQDDCLAVYDSQLRLKHVYYFPSVYKGGSSITYKDGVVEVACNAPIICFYKDGEFTDKIEENDKDYDEELKYIVKNELDTKKVTDKNGNVYSIDTIYPALYKNNEKKVSIPLWQFLTKTVGIALLITFVLIVAWIGLILVVDMLKKRV